MKEQLRSLIKEIMDLDINNLDSNRNLKEVSEWDSFYNLMLIAEIENHFRIRFSSSDIEGIDTINKILNLIKKKLDAEEG